MQSQLSPGVRTLTLALLGTFLLYVFWIVASLSPAFEQGTEGSSRPLAHVVLLFAFAFIAYVIAWALISRFLQESAAGRSHTIEIFVIFGFAIAFRCVMAASVPIQEIDLYRYVWDGAVVSSQLDPYRYGPETVVKAMRNPQLEIQRPGLKDYTEIIEERPALYEVLDVVHFGHYTSPYPPASQFFFGLTIAATPADSDPAQYLFCIKLMLVGFDIATGLIVVLVLSRIGMSTSLSLAYLWCPLVIKEFANGGHLDSIANFFTILAVYFLLRALWPAKQKTDTPESANQNAPRYSSWLNATLGAIALAVAVASKVYPLVLLPIGAIVLFRRGTFWLASATIGLFLIAVIGFSYPMLRHLETVQHQLGIDNSEFEELNDSDQNGLEAFTKFWEMNDFLFMIVVENLKPDPIRNANQGQNDTSKPVPWFRVTSNEFREGVIAKAKPFFVSEQQQRERTYSSNHFAFFTARFLTSTVFCLIVLWMCCVLIKQHGKPRIWLEYCFLTLAWFWLLAPTQNPWYWTWAMPFVPFARGRTWFFVSGVLFVYYLRFWFRYHLESENAWDYLQSRFGDLKILELLFPFADKFPYQGTMFFDFYMPILQFAPILLFLFFGWLGRYLWGVRRKSYSADLVADEGNAVS